VGRYSAIGETDTLDLLTDRANGGPSCHLGSWKLPTAGTLALATWRSVGLCPTLLIETYLAEASTACVMARFPGIVQFLSFGQDPGDPGFVFGGARNLLRTLSANLG
jgi:hypothetical protein